MHKLRLVLASLCSSQALRLPSQPLAPQLQSPAVSQPSARHRLLLVALHGAYYKIKLMMTTTASRKNKSKKLKINNRLSLYRGFPMPVAPLFQRLKHRHQYYLILKQRGLSLATS
ncbi:Uncharacterised protein [Vibrio cholerae]|nr:Uncharacterised protein [Vibrio cholerae]